MWSSKWLSRWLSGAAAFFCAMFLSACGFTPMYGGENSVARLASHSNIEIASIPDREGQYLRNELIDRLYLDGRPAETDYLLNVAPLRIVTTNLGIRKDATATRAMANIDTTLRLVEKRTGAVLLERPVRVTGGYNFLDNQFATLVSRRSVHDNMLGALADNIVTELGLYFTHAEKAGTLPVSIADRPRDPAGPLPSPAVPAAEKAPKREIVPVTESSARGGAAP
jgi:LPS-assembly lipoprotein